MRFHVRRLGPEMLIVIGGAFYALLGRGRWANVEADHGFWFSAAQSMVAGGRAMHEVRLQWGPMPLWILEGVGRVFGMRIASFVVFQFVVGLLAILGVQIFARRFLGPIERWICAALLVVLIVWMVGSGNLLYPCAFAMSQALLLAIVALILHEIVVRRGRLDGAFATGILAGAAFLTKQEFGIAAALGIGAMTLLAPALDAKRKALVLAASALACLATYFGVLFAVARGEDFSQLVRSNLLWPWSPVPGPWKNFYRKTLGLDDVGARLIEAANSLADLLAIGGSAWFVLYFADLRRRARVAMAAGLIALWVIWWWRWTEGSHFLPLTLTLPVVVAACVLALFRQRGTSSPLPAALRRAEVASATQAGEAAAERRMRQLPGLPHPDPPPSPRLWRTRLPRGEWGGSGALVALALGALVLVQRVGYRGNVNGSYAGIGYVLAVPVAASVIWPAIRGPRDAGWRSFVALAVFLCLIAPFGVAQWKGLEDEWRGSTALETPRGTVYVSRNYSYLFSTYQFLKANTAPGDPILVMPQTYGLDFLLDRRNLSYFCWIAPGYLTDEQELIARLGATPPRAAVVFREPFPILHGGTFGSGFADGVMRWLEGNLPGGAHGGVSYERRFLPAGRAGR